MLRGQSDQLSFPGVSALVAGSCSFVLFVQRIWTNWNLMRSLLPMSTRPGPHSLSPTVSTQFEESDGHSFQECSFMLLTMFEPC